MKSKHEIQGMADTWRRSTVLAAMLLGISLFTPPARAGQTTTYGFLADRSTITQTGGIAGIHRTYTITGTFQLTLDSEAGTASFNHVDANAVDDSPFQRTLDPNDVFNMTGLAGVIIDRTTVQFEGTADDGSSVWLTLTFADDAVTLKGQTTPPPNSADFFIFALDAVAQRKYSGGRGVPNDPYQIATAADLIALGETPEDYDKHFILTADIDLDPNLPGRKVFDKAVIAPDNDPKGTWGGFQDTPFTGLFDGNAHTISHLTITGRDYLGLFGRLGSGAEVRDLGVVDVNATGSGYNIGGLAGENSGWIAASYSSGEVNGTHGVGGLVGSNDDGRITSSYSSNSVRGDSHVGGLVGLNYYGSIATSYSSSSVNGESSVGGLVGWNAAYVAQCYSTGAVSGKESVGGLVGSLWACVTQCYSTGPVSGDFNVGGLVGCNEDGDVSHCYSISTVKGTDCVGGLVGLHNSWAVTQCYSTGDVSGAGGSVGGLIGSGGGGVTASFWDTQTSGQATSAAGTGKTTAEMQTASTFIAAGWDFVGETGNGTEDIWWILEGKDYPRLSWQLPTDDFEDGKAGPLWMLYQPEPQAVHLREVNGRLEVEAIAQSENVDAIYAAEGWRLDATKAFAIQVDFHFSKQGGGDGRVTLGVVPSLDPSAMQWAELEAGCFESGPFYLYEVRDGSWVQEVVADRSSDGGTLYMSYDPDADELYLSYTGYGKANNWRTVKGLLKGRWGSVPVSVILSGGSEGMALTGADAWLDNFAVSSGVLVLN